MMLYDVLTQKRNGIRRVLRFVIATCWVLIGSGFAAPSPLLLGAQNLEWQHIGPTGDADVFDMAVAPDQSQRLYVTTRNGVYRSIDGGANWEQVLSGFIREVEVDPLNGDMVYAGPSFYKSIDGGSNWTTHTEGMTCTNLATLDVAKSPPSLLFTGSF